MVLTLKQVRMLAGLTQAQAANAIGVCKHTYRKIEAHPDSATIEQAKKLSKLFAVSYDQIFFGRYSN